MRVLMIISIFGESKLLTTCTIGFNYACDKKAIKIRIFEIF